MSDLSDPSETDPDFDERPSRLWQVELAFWHPATLTDDEMESFFPDRDGRWSRQTKAAIARHGAKGLDLNQSWALVPQHWTCPICQRSKVDILRLSSRGILLANLEEHHDHLRDYVGRRARALFGDHWETELPPGCGAIADTLEQLVSCFSPELVCTECNAADGKAKIILKSIIPPYFSFSPNEIKTFIEPVANADHRIVTHQVEAAWRACAPSLKERVALIDQTLHMIHAGTLYRQRGTSSVRMTLRQFDPQYQLYQTFLRESDRDQRGRALSQMTVEFLARSVQKDSPVISPRPRKATSSSVAPTEKDYASYSDAVSPRRWRDARADWSCPVCKRSKRELLRRSGSGKWTGGIRVLAEPVAESDPLTVKYRRRTLPGFTHAFILQGSRSVEICSDCADITARTKARRTDLTDVTLCLEDITSCIRSATPHAAHDVDWDEAARRAQANQVIGPAWEAFYKHRALSSHLGHLFRVIARQNGEARALEEATEELMFVTEIDQRAEALVIVKWLLQEDERHDQERERAKAEYLARKAAVTNGDE